MHRILFLMRSLEVGGAERQMVELVKNMDHTRYEIHVVTFYNGGALRPFIENIPGVQVTSLGKSSRWDLISFFRKLIVLIKKFQPDVIQSYLDVPNSFNVVVAKLLGIKTIVRVGASYIDFSRYDWTASLVYKVGAFLSHFSDKVIANSKAGKEYNLAHGYSAKNMSIIYNGIDTQTFHPSKLDGTRMRSTWNINNDEKVVGIVGRIDPMKDHPTFLRAAARVSEQFSNCRFVCVGRGTPAYQQEMIAMANTLLNANKVLWINNCKENDIPAAYNAFDILVLSSYGEGLSNALVEGMACGLPCVVTDVGDSAFAVGETGLVVPPQDPDSLANAICAILKMSNLERTDLGQKARTRVEDYFSMGKMISAYEAAFDELVKK